MSLGAAVTPVVWEATHWDDPRVAGLREEMNREVGPRYAPSDGSARPFPPAPVAEEVLVSWLAVLGG